MNVTAAIPDCLTGKIQIIPNAQPRGFCHHDFKHYLHVLTLVNFLDGLAICGMPRTFQANLE